MRSPSQPPPAGACRRRRWRASALAVVAAVLALAGIATSAQAATSAAQAPAASTTAATHQAAAKQPSTAPHVKPIVRSAVRHDTSPQLRHIKAPRLAPGTKVKALPMPTVPHHPGRTSSKFVTPKAGTNATAGTRAGPTAGTAVKAAAAAGTTSTPGTASGTEKTTGLQSSNLVNTMPPMQQNFEGVGNLNGVLPPDTEGAVGPNDYVQMINLSFAVYSKTGSILYGPVPNTTLWQGFGGPCETVNGGDPVVQYDEQADRWFVSQLAYPGGSEGYHECIAVSQTGDPLGAWYRYDFLFSSNTLNDYPKFGIWPDAYYMSANDFLNESQFTGVSVIAFDRAQMLAGQPASDVEFTTGDQYSSLMPSNSEGGALGFSPPPGSPDPFFMTCDAANGGPCTSDEIDMWNFHVDWSNPANSTFGNNLAPSQTFPVAAFNSNLCNYSRDCITQPGTSEGLDALSDRIMFQAAYRNQGNGTQAIVFNQTVNVSPNPPSTNQAGVRWYELTNSGSGWSLGQQGTYAPDSDNRWMASADLDASGDVAMGFSVSSASTYPSIRIAGRLAGDPANQLSQGETTVINGGGSQTNSAARWGDYSAMHVDPTDGCTFWYTQEYMPSTSDSNWQTRIASFKFPSCTVAQHGKISGTVTDSATGKPIADATVSTSDGTTTTDSSGNYSFILPVGSYDLTTSAFGYATKTVSGVEVTDGGTTTDNIALTTVPSVTVSGTVTDGSGHGWPLYASISISGKPGGPVWTNPATGQYSVTLPENATYNATVAASLPGYQTQAETIAVGTSAMTQNVSMPVDPSCFAPGYQLSYGTPALSEPFAGSTIANGWTVSDGNGSGHVWQINDPENRGNMTGGTGNFADINSDYYGSGHTQDTTLTSPAVDLTGETAPVIRFNTDYQGYGTQTGNVDLSTDGGTTWSTVWHQTTSTRTGLQTVPITQAAGDSNVEVRFHFTSTFGWWWQVDNVTVQNQNCDITPGGLVVGNVTDGNNGNYLNGAVITSADNPGTHVTTVATSDPANPGGYYQFFYPLTGSHPFTATDAPYTAATKTANVAADSATSLSFSLAAARLTITPSSVTPTQLLGNTATSNLTIANTGNAPATVKLDERSGAYQVLSKQGAPVRRISFDDGGEAPGPGWFAGEGGHAVQDTSAGTPKDPTWSTIAQYPSAIEDNSSDSNNGLVYSVGGYDGSSILASGYVYDPSQNTWSAIAPMPVARERPNVAFISGKLYVSGGWGTDGNPVAETDVYDPSSNSWSIVAPNPSPTAGGGVAVANGQMFIVDGCSDGNCDAATTSVSYDPGSNSWSTIAAYPNPDSWESCGGIAGKVYCAGGIDSNTGATYKTAFVFDPSSGAWSPIASLPIDLWGSYSAAANGLLLTSAGVTDSSSTITNQGFSYDPSSDSWTALPNAQYPLYRGGGACGFYKVGGSPGLGGLAADSETLSGFTECGVTDVPWLDESATTATLQPGQSVTIAVTTSATTADSVTQPGTYTAQLGVEQNTPYPVAPVNITMTVTPPSGWGKIAGTVTGTTCKGVANPILGAQVQADSKTWTFSLKTDKNGNYAFWAPAASNPFQIIASQNTWIAQTTKINIKSQKTTTINFNLSPTSC